MIINTVYNEDGEFVREEPFDADIELDKLYPTEQTNEEWLKSLSTEELANYIATQCADAVRLWREMQYWTANEKCKSNKWYVWLKEIHK